MLFFSSIFISSLFHFRNDLNKTKNTQESYETNFDVDDLKDKRYEYHNWIKNIDED